MIVAILFKFFCWCVEKPRGDESWMDFSRRRGVHSPRDAERDAVNEAARALVMRNDLAVGAARVFSASS